MDTVTELELMRGVRLTCVRADRFKTGCLSMTFLAPHTKKTAALNAVLPYVLRRGTARCPDTEALAAALDDLYGARIEPAIRKRGEVAALGFCADFPDGAFLPGKIDVLSGVAGLMGELILSPATFGGRLRAETVETERENLIDDINAEINDKRSYVALRLVESMYRGQSYGVAKLGSLADASRVTVFNLTRHYKEIISSAPLEVFYCGAEMPERVAAVVKSSLSALPRLGMCPMPGTAVDAGTPTGSVKRGVERMDVTQGRLMMGFRLGKVMEEPDHAALTVFNALFGGSVTSKLFLNVREKLGLCYYVSSAVDRHKGAMFVSAGMDFDRERDVEEEVLHQLQAIAEGDVGERELEGAKKCVISSILTSLDDPMGLESLYLDRAILGAHGTMTALAKRCGRVTVEELSRIAASAKLSHTYFLTSGEEVET